MYEFDSLVDYVDHYQRLYSLAFDEVDPTTIKVITDLNCFNIAMLRQDELALDMSGCLDSGHF